MEPHSAAVFTKFFDGKVDDIRSRTANVAPSTIVPRDIPSLASFELCTTEEVACMIRKAPSKQCELDPAPTWLIKQCCDMLAPVVTLLVNQSFEEGTFSDGGKVAVVKPILKKPNLDPFDLKSWRPISKISFVSKIVERFAIQRFSRHCSTYTIYCQSISQHTGRIRLLD